MCVSANAENELRGSLMHGLYQLKAVLKQLTIARSMRLEALTEQTYWEKI